MADLLGLSADVIDGRIELERAGPLNRINHELSELSSGIAVVEAFSHCVAFKTDDGLVCFDTSNEHGGHKCVRSLRKWSQAKLNSLVFTHGHIDHVGGAAAFLSDTPEVRVVAHENVPARFERYRLTNGYNHVINERQFGQFKRRGYDLAGARDFLPQGTPEPDTTYRSSLDLVIGDMDFHLYHARGETDDHTWAWIPDHRAICAGDFFIWAFPNAGNPQKAQRYPREWASALRDMVAKEPELFLPAHGLPIQGANRIRHVLTSVAEALESLVSQTLTMMNQGADLNDIIHSVSVPGNALSQPWMAPVYDEPEFVVQNIWRLYGGWYDGNPAHLKPVEERKLATEIAHLSGGATALAERGLALMETDIRLACHLVELAAQAEPELAAVHAIRAQVYQYRRSQETSLMAKGIFGAAANASKAKLSPES